MINELQGRLFKFSVEVIKEVRNLPTTIEFKVISYQILKSATSVGANYEEAQGAVSKADFSNKVAISLKEMRETNYWIRIINEIQNDKKNWYKLDEDTIYLLSFLSFSIQLVISWSCLIWIFNVINKNYDYFIKISSLTQEETKTIHGNTGKDVGVIAQEIESILPEAVTTRDSGYKAVNYEKIVPLLIEAVKELQAKVKELENK